MDASTTTYLIQWIIAHGYFIFFILAFFDGPIETAAAGVACALGYFNIFIIILLAVLGDLSADAIWYGLGYFVGYRFIDRHGSYIGLTQERVEKIKRTLHAHSRKTIVGIKLSPIIPVPGIILLGAVRVPPRKFLTMSLFITVPKALFFALLGFYSGRAYVHLSGIVATSQYILWAVVAFIAIIFFSYQKLSSYLSKDVL